MTVIERSRTGNDLSVSLEQSCTAVSLATNVSSPQLVGSQVLFTATATGCTEPQYRFLLWDGSRWTIVREWSAIATYPWDTTGRSVGDYHMEVWARQGVAGSWQAYTTSGAFGLLPADVPCTAVGLATDIASPQLVGKNVLFTATATGCTEPQYRFLLWDGSRWAVLQDWSASGTFLWNTTDHGAGGYHIEVWARHGDAGSWQAYVTSGAFALLPAGAPCTAVSLATNVSSPQLVGSQVLFTATATGCTEPQYRFLLWDGSRWTIVREWSAIATYPWDTTGRSVGDYHMEVWARQGVAGSWQAFITSQRYDLWPAGPPCGAITALRDIQAETVSFTVHAAICAEPQYRFLLWDGRVWTVAQDWSTAPNYLWSTAGLSSYNYVLEVWARQGAAGPWQSYAMIDAPLVKLLSPIPVATQPTALASLLPQAREIVETETTTWSRAVKLRELVRATLSDGDCNVLAFAYWSVGRMVGLPLRIVAASANPRNAYDAHTTVEVWRDDIGRWVISDPTFDGYWSLGTTTDPVGATDLSTALRSGGAQAYWHGSGGANAILPSTYYVDPTQLYAYVSVAAFAGDLERWLLTDLSQARTAGDVYLSSTVDVATLGPEAVVPATPHLVSAAEVPPPQLDSEGIPSYGYQLVWQQSITFDNGTEVIVDPSFLGSVFVMIGQSGEWSVTTDDTGMVMTQVRDDGAVISPIVLLENEGTFTLKTLGSLAPVDVAVYAVRRFPSANESIE